MIVHVPLDNGPLEYVISNGGISCWGNATMYPNGDMLRYVMVLWSLDIKEFVLPDRLLEV